MEVSQGARQGACRAPRPAATGEGVLWGEAECRPRPGQITAQAQGTLSIPSSSISAPQQSSSWTSLDSASVSPRRPRHVYSEARPTGFHGAYFPVSPCRIAASTCDFLNPNATDEIGAAGASSCPPHASAVPPHPLRAGRGWILPLFAQHTQGGFTTPLASPCRGRPLLRSGRGRRQLSSPAWAASCSTERPRRRKAPPYSLRGRRPGSTGTGWASSKGRGCRRSKASRGPSRTPEEGLGRAARGPCSCEPAVQGQWWQKRPPHAGQQRAQAGPPHRGRGRGHRAHTHFLHQALERVRRRPAELLWALGPGGSACRSPTAMAVSKSSFRLCWVRAEHST